MSSPICVVEVHNCFSSTPIKTYFEQAFRPQAGETTVFETRVEETSWFDSSGNARASAFARNMRDMDPIFAATNRGNERDPVNLVCTGMLRPEYVTVDNIGSIMGSGGFVVKVFAAINYGMRREERKFIGVCTVYVDNEKIPGGQPFLYIATICALNSVPTILGFAGKIIDATKAIARASSSSRGIRGVSLESLMYCRNPLLEEVDTSACLSWLHDYYLKKQHFQFVDTHIRDPDGTEVMEYEPVPASPGQFNKKLKTNKKYKFSTNHTIPMFWLNEWPQ